MKKKFKPTTGQSKQVVLVNNNDEVVGQANVLDAHQGKGMLHRACSVFLFNDQGQILIQQRSAKKLVAANLWANTVCGNVQPAETVQTCALRRLREELGIVAVQLIKLGKFQYSVKFDNGFVEHEIDTVFVGQYNGQPQPNPAEVQDFGWASYQELWQRVDQFAPWVKIILSQKHINQLLKKYESAYCLD